jgi:uncharacterized membrane protein
MTGVLAMKAAVELSRLDSRGRLPPHRFLRWKEPRSSPPTSSQNREFQLLVHDLFHYLGFALTEIRVASIDRGDGVASRA